jgi:hypothetical protein
MCWALFDHPTSAHVEFVVEQMTRLQVSSEYFCFPCKESLPVVGLERAPLSFVLELLGRKSSGSGLENRECGRRDPSR